MSLARQYRYPVMYLPLLRQVPELIFGEPPKTGDGGEETHLDRELDLRFSGDVFTAACREPFLGIALPLFEADPLDRQPALVVDAGCGDGALLEALYLAVRERTARGRRLAERPLVMAGVDPSPVARRMASARLSAAGVPHVIMDGGHRRPGRPGAGARGAWPGRQGRAARLQVRHPRPGLLRARPGEPEDPEDPGEASQPAGGHPAGGCPARGRPAAWCRSVRAAGRQRDTRQLSGLRPRRAVPPAGSRSRAGMAGWVIEAHAAPAAILARLIGRTHATVLDATHGYACQYPVEPGVFAWAARAGGFVSRGHAEPGAATLGHTILTIDHFVAADPARPARSGLVTPCLCQLLRGQAGLPHVAARHDLAVHRALHLPERSHVYRAEQPG